VERERQPAAAVGSCDLSSGRAYSHWFSYASSNVSDTTVLYGCSWTCSDCGCSALPARSVEKNPTDEVWVSVNGPVYTVLDVVGVDPSVV
jgi:hypothetical protein